MSIKVGTAPSSWGIWFPSDPKQTPYQRFLDEVAEAGYDWIELGPHGYLPTDLPTLQSELDSRGLKVSSAQASGYPAEPSEWPALEAEVRLQAAAALGRLGWVDEAAKLLLALARDPAVEARVQVGAVAALRGPWRADDLLALVRDPRVRVEVREKAMEALERLRRADDLLALARDQEVETWVRLRSAEALGWLERADDLLTLARDETVEALVREQFFDGFSLL